MLFSATRAASSLCTFGATAALASRRQVVGTVSFEEAALVLAFSEKRQEGAQTRAFLVG